MTADAAVPLGIQQLLYELAVGRLDPVAVTEACLQRIDDLDDQVRAFSWVDADGARATARERARQLAAGITVGPLHGVPIAVKEIFDVAGAPAEYGSQVLLGARATADAAVVTRLRDAGAVIIGSTRSHEFAWGITTQHAVRPSTRNPLALDRVPGGSSGGAGAAVAAGMVPACLATDTGGSIRIPSAYCGVAGIKPTFGSVDVTGVAPLAPGLDTVGVIARRVGDLWPVLSALGHQGAIDERTDLHSLEDLRIGIARRLMSSVTDGLRSVCYDQALEVCRQSGVELVEVDTPDAEEIRAVFLVIQGFEAVRTHTQVLGLYPQHRADYGDDIASRLDLMSSITEQEYLAARDEGEGLRARLVGACRQVTGLLTPVSLVAPPFVDSPDTVQVQGRSIPGRDAVMGFTVPQNLAGLPTVAFPGPVAADGLPFGLQLTGGPGRERHLLAVAALLEGAMTP